MMPKRKAVRLHATQVTPRPLTWAQVELAALEDLQALIGRAPQAARLLVLLIRHMRPGAGGVVVASRETMRELLGASMPTVERALRLLIAEGWVQRIRIGSAHALAVNDRVAWVGPRHDLAHAVFSATVIASRSEQDAAALATGPLRRVPTLEAGEIALPVGPGLAPPAQPALDGVPPVVPVVGSIGDQAGEGPESR